MKISHLRDGLEAAGQPARNRMNRRNVLSAMSSALALAAAGCGPRAADPLSVFDGEVEDWTRAILADSPELASQAGVSADQAGGPYQHRLNDRSPLAVEARRTAALRRVTELRGLDSSALDAEDALTYAVLEAQFSASAAAARHAYGAFSPLGGIAPYVLNPLDSAFVTLPDFLDSRHPIDSFADADAYLARLEAAAAAIDQQTAHARQDGEAGVIAPGFIIDATLRLLDGAIGQPPMAQTYFTSLQRKLDALLAREADEAAKAEAQVRAGRLLARAEAVIRTQITPACQRAAALLRALRPRAGDEAGVWRLPDGGAYYADALRIATTTDLTPDQIHRIGLDRMRELTALMDVALRRIGMTDGPVGARMSAMTADPRYQYPNDEDGRAQLIADVRARVARIMELAPRWFGALPEARLDVRRVPPAIEASSPGAYYQPPTLDGASPGIYYINLRNTAEITRIDLPTQDFHEAVPGHHFQVALAQEQTQTPLLRRLMTFVAYGEGWGLYAEQLAEEQGLYEGDPIGRIGYLRWQMWRAARLVVDTGLHAKRWSRQQAIDYLIETLGDAPGIIATEVDRYITWPGQACGYEIGRRAIAQLREEARNQLGPYFDLRDFHDLVLLNGETPLGVLEKLVRDWIPVQRERAERAERRE